MPKGSSTRSSKTAPTIDKETVNRKCREARYKSDFNLLYTKPMRFKDKSKPKPVLKDAIYYREFLNELPTGLRTTAIAWIGIVTKPLAVDFNWRSDRAGDFSPASEGFEHFLNDMGQRPENAILIRINNNKIYCKSNCMWINWREYSYMKKIPASRFTHCRIIRVRE